MFIGEYSHTIDEKGRISIPAKFRRHLSQGVVVTRGLDGCLFVYPSAEWQTLAKRISSLPLSNKQGRAFARLMLAGAWDAELDAQGRIMLPEYLRSFAKLGKHVAVTGLYNRFEIWQEDAWAEYRVATETGSDDIAASLTELGV